MILTTPGLLPGLLLLGAALVAVAARIRPRFITETAVTVTTLVFLLWLGRRPTAPLAPEQALAEAATGWLLTPTTWTLGAAWLLLLLFALLAARYAPTAPRQDPSQPILMLLLGGVTLAAVWASTPQLLLLSWFLLALLGATAVFWPGLAAVPQSGGRGLVGGLFAGFFLVWYGAALGGVNNVATWLPPARAAALLGVLAQLGIAPLWGWRLRQSVPLATAVLLTLAPALAGAALLAQLVATGPIPYLLLVTLVGLLAVLGGLVWAWANVGASASFGVALTLVAAGWLLLGGVWAGPAALAAEGRVLLLAVGAIFLSAPVNRRQARLLWLPIVVGQVVGLAALAGLPLTAGFNGRAALYDAWLAAGGWPLVALATLLHLAGVTAVFLHGWHITQLEPAHEGQSTRFAGILYLLPTLGLLALPARALSATHWATWLALLLPLSGAILLLRFSPLRQWSVNENEPTVWRSLSALRLPGLLRDGRVWHGVRLAVGSLREAALLLEGERGLLWLLLLLALILLAA